MAGTGGGAAGGQPDDQGLLRLEERKVQRQGLLLNFGFDLLIFLMGKL